MFCKLDWKRKNSGERRKGHKGRNRIKERKKGDVE
jgi:hypothetical protein